MCLQGMNLLESYAELYVFFYRNKNIRIHTAYNLEKFFRKILMPTQVSQTLSHVPFSSFQFPFSFLSFIQLSSYKLEKPIQHSNEGLEKGVSLQSEDLQTFWQSYLSDNRSVFKEDNFFQIKSILFYSKSFTTLPQDMS